MTKFRTFDFSILPSRSDATVVVTVRRLKNTFVVFLVLFIGLRVASAQTFTSLLSFNGSNGAFPQGSLVEGNDHRLYGTTPYGGAHGVGSVFEISPEGKLTTLHSFDRTDGGGPYAGLIRARTGNFYGVTSGAGLGQYGTVFEITPEGKLTTLYNFCSQPNCADGATPYAGLVEGRNGDLYGSTYSGGANSAGTIFELTPNGQLTTLYNFCSKPNCADGTAPLIASLLEGKDGNFYGTTPMGGAYGRGTVFEIKPKGELTTLYSFCSKPNCTDGATPFAELVQGSSGKFYGTTYSGGAYDRGTIFEIIAKGKLIGLHSFDDTDGARPYAGLMEGRNGNFYGTTYGGGASLYGDGGVVFEITPKGKLRTLYSFCSEPGCVDGRGLYAGLTETLPGILYGATIYGGLYGTSACGAYGDYGCGALFRLAVGPRARTLADPIDGNDGP